MPARPSMVDVARVAGVSAQTVSRVSNGQANVDDATRTRVLEAMAALGYRPNGAARALKSGRFHTIGVIMTSLQTLGNIRALDAISAEAARAGFSVLLMPIADTTLPRVSGAYQRMTAQAVDGAVIILQARFLDETAFALPPGVPVVVIDSATSPGYTVVATDHALGARQVTGHLLSLGHRQVWHIAGPQASFSAALRAESWAAALRDAGLTPPPPLHGDWTAESGYRHGLTLGRRPEVTAIFCANDQMAVGAMRALRELGREIPGDVSVAGFDDMDVAASLWPPLTTVRQDFDSVGRLSVRRLLAKVAAGPAAEAGTTIVPTRLIIRSSTAAPIAARRARSPKTAILSGPPRGLSPGGRPPRTPRCPLARTELRRSQTAAPIARTAFLSGPAHGHLPGGRPPVPP
jgi:DNA-binding LacI/PurR family transcriptional regulator